LLRYLVEDPDLRAQLRTGNLLTGQLYVALDLVPDAPASRVDWASVPLEMPARPGELRNLEAKVGAILAKLEKAPLDSLVVDADKVLVTLDQTRAEATRVLQHVDAELTPEVRAALKDTRRALGAAERVMNGPDTTLVGPKAPVQRDLREAPEDSRAVARLSENIAGAVRALQGSAR
jgi:paraquat-inducible protein B